MNGNQYNNQYYGYPSGPGSWHNGNQKPDTRFPRLLAEMKSETANLEQQKKQLQEEINNLKLQLKEQDEKSEETIKCEQKFESWGGVKIVQSTETVCKVALPFNVKGKDCGEYTIGFKKLGLYWTVDYYCMPPCMKLIPQRVDEARIDTVDMLSNMIRTLQLEADMFIRRREQFQQAMTLSSSTIRIFPSVNSTSVLLEFTVDDNGGSSDLTQASVYLTYRLDKFLPEQPKFTFQGGDPESIAEFKNQLNTLENMPLKEAIIKAFKSDLETSEIESTFSSDVENRNLTFPNTPLTKENEPKEESNNNTPKVQPSTSPPPQTKSPILMPNPVAKRGGTRGRPRGRGRGNLGSRERK